MPFAEWVTEPFLQGSMLDTGGVGTAAFLDEILALLHARGVQPTPGVHLRVVEALSTVLIVRQLEEAVLAEGAVRPSSSEKAPAGVELHPFLEALGKWQERRRKAMKELEEACGQVGAPHVEVGLADIMKPIIKQAEGVLEEAMAYESRKREANKARPTAQ